MTDKPTPTPLPTLPAVPSQTLPPAPQGSTINVDPALQVETVEEEPYTIKCICDFPDDDGNTIYCETCDTWQHIECFYPDNREEVTKDAFDHSCADCKPRNLDRQKAIERALRLRTIAAEQSTDKKAKRPPSKSHKKKPKPNDAPVNGHGAAHEGGKHGSPSDHPHPAKKAKTSHRPSQSLSSQPAKRSPSHGNSKTSAGHPPSPATTPPDLPDNFQIHHYSKSFCSLYDEEDVPDGGGNKFANLAIPGALSRWLREPNTMKQEVGRTPSEVFQANPPKEGNGPKLEVQVVTRSVPDNVVRWRSLKTTIPIEKDIPLVELNGIIGFQKDYCADQGNLWGDLSSPLPFVFFHPVLPLYIDTRQEGSLARYVRRSCKPNAQLDTYLFEGSEYHFWIVSDRSIAAHEPITLPWDFRLEKSVGPRWLHLLGLSDDEASGQAEPEMDDTEYTAISNWIDRILSEYGGCACDLNNNCAFARFHRHYLWSKAQPRTNPKKKQRKLKAQAISPSSTGQTTNSRAASEGHAEEGPDHEGRSQSGSSRSKPPSRDLTPLRQGSFDQLGILTELTDRDKRKVAMVEDTFRRLEQQQPPRKKKRVSDGTNGSATTTKSKSRHGSTVSHSTYVDAGTGARKSGSPASTRSPQLGHKKSSAKRRSTAEHSRESSVAPHREYCDAAVQTDPVEGEWYSEPRGSPRPKKRIISLSTRLLNSRHKVRADEEVQRRRSSASQASVSAATEPESPVLEQKARIPSISADSEPSPCNGDVQMVDAPSAPLAIPVATSLTFPDGPTNPTKTQTPDLRVQLPPVPAFDNTGLAAANSTTPLSASSSITQSPISALPSPFAPPAVHGLGLGLGPQPSPIKKKLSLSDYKSRMNKAAKGPGTANFVKPSLPSPEVTKVDLVLDSNAAEKPGDNVSRPATSPTINGSLQGV